MNLFFKFSLLLLLFCVSLQASAVNLQALYTSACNREIGLVFGVDKQFIHFLTIEGKVQKIRRYEVLFWVDYPTDSLPMSESVDLRDISHLVVKTQKGNDIVDLVRGWPIGFTEEKISFIDFEGKESLIDRDNIFSLEYVQTNSLLNFTRRKDLQLFSFVHPYAFRDCPLTKAANTVFPQQILSDPVVIKKELDRLQQGYEKIKRYTREQNFYPLPHVHENSTRLGIWQNFNSRYGSSTKRINNLTPVLTDESSSDVFDYQHIFISGSAPFEYSVHEESQTEIFYSFKASYFHFSVMVDPSLLLVGTNYPWQKSDFDEFDSRVNDRSSMELGFDYKSLALLFFVNHDISTGIYFPNYSAHTYIPLSQFGLRYQNHLFSAEILKGQGNDRHWVDDLNGDTQPAKTDMQFLRLNMNAKWIPKWNLTYSYINKKITHASFFDFNSASSTHSILGYYEFRKRFNIGAYVSVEKVEKSFSATTGFDSASKTYPKGGINFSLSF